MSNDAAGAVPADAVAAALAQTSAPPAAPLRETNAERFTRARCHAALDKAINAGLAYEREIGEGVRRAVATRDGEPAHGPFLTAKDFFYARLDLLHLLENTVIQEAMQRPLPPEATS
jgi:hypothetical protein